MAITFSSTQLGTSGINYTKYLSGKITKTDRYKDATLLDFALSPFDASFVRLVRGAYITINSTLYPKVFTGYITNEPSLTYLGHKNNVPIWGYVYQASSDEYVLNLKPVGILPTFTNVSMGYIIKQLAARLVPNTFDVTGVQDGPLVAQYTPDSTKKFSDLVNEFEESASYRFYANDKKLYFVPQSSSTLGKVTIDGNDNHFTPERLDIRPASSGAAIANDVTVVGSIEPQAYVTEYFVGTGLDAKFPLASSVFGVDASVILDETFQNSSVDSSKWDVYDTASQWLQIGNGYLNIQGGSGNASFDVRLQSKSPIPLEGKIRLTHGDWRLTSGAGYICGLWTQTPNSFNTGCVYSLYYGSNTLRPVINGSVDNTQTIITNSSYRYVIRTVVEFAKTNRLVQQYNFLDSAGGVGSYGGTLLDDTATWETLISEIDPANGSILRQVTFTNTSTLSSAVAYAKYIPAASDTLNAAFTSVTISIPVDASLETADRVALTNSSFDLWANTGNSTPDGWATSTPMFVWSEASVVDSGYSVKLLGDSTSLIEQNVSALVTAGSSYSFMAKLRKSGSMTGSVVFSLVGVGVDQSYTVPVSSLSNTAFQFFTGQITASLTSVPTDLVFRVSCVGGALGQAAYVDSVQLISSFSKRLVGPNEMDGLDGVAPIATIVTQGGDSKSSYLGTPQYNTGQSELVFFKDSTTLTSNVPPANQIIKLRYRSAGPSLGRAVNYTSAALESVNWGDDGVRSIVRTDIVPIPRTSEECELAAAAIVTENSSSRYEGSYSQWSAYFTQEPKAGAAVEFLNLSNMADVSVEEINEVVTTIESEKPIERFLHKISFGKSTSANKLLGKIGSQAIGLQRAATQVAAQPVDILSVAANATYATDVLSPSLIGWSATSVSIDTGEDLSASDLFFEVRYTDEGWGVDDGLNLVIARTTNRVFTAPRNLRGRTYFIRKARKGNHILWSEDQTQGSVYSGASSKAISLGPDGQMCTVSSATLASSASITGLVSGLSGSTFCGSVSVLGPAGKSFRLSLGASVNNFTTTGYWQRVSVSLSGSAPTSMSLTYTGSGSSTVSTTKWSVEESAVETFYAKTAAIKYGPTSRYSSLLKVSFPIEDVVVASGFVAPPVAPYSCTQAVEEFGNNYVITAMLTLLSDTGTTTGYNTEFNFYSDSACTVSDAGWLGGPDIIGADVISVKTPPWPKAGDIRYVRTRVRAVNANNEVTGWVESVAGAGSTITAGISPIGVPEKPLTTTSSLASTGAEYTLSSAWTLPTDLGSIVGVQRAAFFYTTAVITTPESIIPLAELSLDLATLAADDGPFPTINADYYVAVGVRTLNGDLVASDWTISTRQLLAAGTGTVDASLHDITMDTAYTQSGFNGTGACWKMVNGSLVVRGRYAPYIDLAGVTDCAEIRVMVEANSPAKAMLPSQPAQIPYNGDSHGISSSAMGTFEVVIPKPPSQGTTTTLYIHGLTVGVTGSTSKFEYKNGTAPPQPTRYLTLSLTQADLDSTTAPTDIPGVASGVTTTVVQDELSWKPTVSWTPPSVMAGIGVWEIEIALYTDDAGTSFYGGGATYAYKGETYAGTNSWTADRWPKDSAIRSFRARVRGVNRDVTPPLFGAYVNQGAPVVIAVNSVLVPAPDVSSVTLSVAGGNFKYYFGVGYTPPADGTSFAGVQATFKTYLDPGGTISDGGGNLGWYTEGSPFTIGADSSGNAEWDRPIYDAWVKVGLQSVNKLNQVNPTIVYSPLVKIDKLFPPTPIANVVASITGDAQRYGVTTTWTPSTQPGVEGYEVELSWWNDVGGTIDTMYDDWSHNNYAAGATTATLLIGGQQDRPTDADYWVKSRVRPVMYGVPGAWVICNTPVSLLKYFNPPAVSGVSVALQTRVIGGASSWRVQTTFTPNASIGTTKYYEQECRVFNDAGATVPDSEWTALPSFEIGETVKTGDWWPWDKTPKWVIVRVFAVNENGVRGTPVTSATTSLAASTGLDLTASDLTKVKGFAVDGAGKFTIDVNAADFVIGADGKLTQYQVDMSKAYNLGPEFDKDGQGLVIIRNLAVSKLLAGTALFTGDVSFVAPSGNQVAIRNGSIDISGSGSTVQVSSGGVVLRAGTNTVTINATTLVASAVQVGSVVVGIGGTINFSDGYVLSSSSAVRSVNGQVGNVTVAAGTQGPAGPTGPQGPTGPAGPTGPQGPAGGGVTSAYDCSYIGWSNSTVSGALDDILIRMSNAGI